MLRDSSAGSSRTHDEDAVENVNTLRPPPLAGNADPVSPRMAEIDDDGVACQLAECRGDRCGDIRRSRVRRCCGAPESPAAPDRSGTGIAWAPSTAAVTGRSPKQFARPRSSSRRYSRSAMVPPSMSQSTSTTERFADE